MGNRPPSFIFSCSPSRLVLQSSILNQSTTKRATPPTRLLLVSFHSFGCALPLSRPHSFGPSKDDHRSKTARTRNSATRHAIKAYVTTLTERRRHCSDRATLRRYFGPGPFFSP